MAARIVSLGKSPRVIPVVIGELQAGGSQSKEVCGSVNLCAGLENRRSNIRSQGMRGSRKGRYGVGETR